MTLLEFIPFWYLVSDKKWWWISYSSNKSGSSIFFGEASFVSCLLFLILPRHNSILFIVLFLSYFFHSPPRVRSICRVVMAICFKEIIKMIWYQHGIIAAAARIWKIWNNIFVSGLTLSIFLFHSSFLSKIPIIENVALAVKWPPCGHNVSVQVCVRVCVFQ